MLPVIAQLDQNQVRSTIDTLARTPLSQILILVTALTVLRFALAPYLAKTPIHKRSGGFAIGRFFNEFSDAIIYAAVVVFMLVRPFAVQTFTIPTGSMEDTLLVNDFVVLDKSIYRRSDPKVGDIVVFKAPPASRRAGEGELDFIKRCQGVPGDVVEIKDGILYRNGERVDEKYVKFATGWNRMVRDFKIVEKDGKFIPVYIEGGIANGNSTFTASEFVAQTFEESQELLRLPAAKIPPNHYLFMGDNREGSYDGRSWGLVHRDAIIGKSWVIWWPMSRWRVTQ